MRGLEKIGFCLFVLGCAPSAPGQAPVPVISKYGQLVVFDAGTFTQVEPRAPKAIYQGGDKLAYLSDGNDLKLYANHRLTVLERGETVEMAVSRHLIAWRSGPALRFPAADGSASTICRSVGRFAVGDSIIVFDDLMQQQIGVHWKGRTFPVADIMPGGEVPWKTGSNTLLLYDLDRRRVLLFYRGTLSTLCNGTDMSRSEPGGDVVAFMDEYDDIFRIFDRGVEYEVEPFAPSDFQVGEGLVAWVNSTGAFRCYQGGQIWDLMDYAPDAFWVRDSLVVFRDVNRFKVFCKGAVETLDQQMPSQWAVSGAGIAWLDGQQRLNLFREGERSVVSREPGIRSFGIHPSVVVYQSNSGEYKVWWNGKLYSHY